MAGINAWLLPVAIIAIGFVNWLLGRSMAATWLVRGSWPMMAGGFALLVAAAFAAVAVTFLLVAGVLLLLALVCVTISIVKRELRFRVG